VYYWITRYYCQFYYIEYLSSTVLISFLSSWGNHLYHHCRSVSPFILWVQITHSSCFATTSSSDGRSKSSFERLCRGVCGLDGSSSASSVSAVTRPFSITDIYSQVVYFHSYCDVSAAISLLLLQCSNNLDTPSGRREALVCPITRFLICFVMLTSYIACASSGCSSSKVAGLIFYATFSFLWTSQVIGNVALATLAGGPFGTWYYFGPRDMGQMVWLNQS
jgi:hypothetical protein